MSLYDKYKYFDCLQDFEAFARTRGKKFVEATWNLRLGSTHWDILAMFCCQSHSSVFYVGQVGARNVQVSQSNVNNMLAAAEVFVLDGEERMMFSKPEFVPSYRFCKCIFDFACTMNVRVNLPVEFYEVNFPVVYCGYDDSTIVDEEECVVLNDDLIDLQVEMSKLTTLPQCESFESRILREYKVGVCECGYKARFDCFSSEEAHSFCPVHDKTQVTGVKKFSQSHNVTMKDVLNFFSLNNVFCVGDEPGVPVLENSHLCFDLEELQVIPDGIQVRIVRDCDQQQVYYVCKNRKFVQQCDVVASETFGGTLVSRDNILHFVVTHYYRGKSYDFIPYYTSVASNRVRMKVPLGWSFLPSQTSNFSELLALCSGVPIKGFNFRLRDGDNTHYKKWVFRQSVGTLYYKTEVCFYSRGYEKIYPSLLPRLFHHFKAKMLPHKQVLMWISCKNCVKGLRIGFVDTSMLEKDDYSDSLIDFVDGTDIRGSTLVALSAASMDTSVMLDVNNKRLF